MTTRCVQLDLFLPDEISQKKWELDEYKKKTFRSIRGLYARNNEMKIELTDLKRMLGEMFKVEIEEHMGKRIRFESNAEEMVRDFISKSHEFANIELQEYKSITDKSLRSLTFKYNEIQNSLMDIHKFLDGVVFKEVEGFLVPSPQL